MNSFNERTSRRCAQTVRKPVPASTVSQTRSGLFRNGSSRKGLAEWEHILGMVLMVAILIVALGIIIELKLHTGSAAEDSACASQVITQAQIVRVTNGEFAPEITCPTKLVDVKTTSEDEAKRAVAEQMRRCWAIWGRGQLQLFGNKEGTYCHVCSMVRVEGTNITGMAKYLDETRMTQTQTYSQYLSGVTYSEGGVFSSEEFQQAAVQTMSTEQPVGVIFYYKKGLTDFGRFKNSVSGKHGFALFAGAASGAVLGFKAGTVVPGLGNKLGAAIGLVGGGVAGGVISFMAMDQPDYMAAVVARPLTTTDLQTLGCQQDVVSN